MLPQAPGPHRLSPQMGTRPPAPLSAWALESARAVEGRAGFRSLRTELPARGLLLLGLGFSYLPSTGLLSTPVRSTPRSASSVFHAHRPSVLCVPCPLQESEATHGLPAGGEGPLPPARVCMLRTPWWIVSGGPGTRWVPSGPAGQASASRRAPGCRGPLLPMNSCDG